MVDCYFDALVSSFSCVLDICHNPSLRYYSGSTFQLSPAIRLAVRHADIAHSFSIFPPRFSALLGPFISRILALKSFDAEETPRGGHSSYLLIGSCCDTPLYIVFVFVPVPGAVLDLVANVRIEAHPASHFPCFYKLFLLLACHSGCALHGQFTLCSILAISQADCDSSPCVLCDLFFRLFSCCFLSSISTGYYSVRYLPSFKHER